MSRSLFIISLCLWAKLAGATASDTSKINYAISDPRHPDCMCHKYQKLADEEYEKMLRHAALPEKEISVKENTNGSTSKLEKKHRRLFMISIKQKEGSKIKVRHKKRSAKLSRANACFKW